MLSQNLYTACVTPFTSNGEEIDYNSLEKILKLQEDAGNGMVLLGSTGEGMSLSDKEKKEVVNFACKLNLNAEVIVGVPSHNLSVALEWIKFCNELPIDGYLITTPIYTKPGVMGQTQWFEKLLNTSKYSSMLYNIPGRAGIRLHAETVANLKDHPKFLAIKDSSGIVDSLVEYKLAAPDIAVYCGDDYLMPATAAEGAVGLISVASNVWPKAVKKYVIDSLDKKKDIDKTWWKVCKALFAASNPIPVKALLKDLNVIDNDNVRLPLSIADLPSRELLLSYNEIISKL